VGVALLGQLAEPSERGTAIVVRALGDRDERVLAEAALAISHLEEDESMPAVVALASHPSAMVRLGAANALARRAASDPDAYVPALIALSRDDDHWVRSWATFGLACADDGRDELREALVERASDDDAEMRGEALEGLAPLRDPRGIELLAASLERGASEVTTPMLTAAIEHPSRALVPALARVRDQLIAAHHDALAAHAAEALDACASATERIEG
jgi:HEAT repeat protein